MTVASIIELVVILVLATAGVIYFAIKAIKNKWIEKLMDTIKEGVKEAEQSGKSGTEKKEYVMEKVKAKCVELQIPYQSIYKLVSLLINTIVKYYNFIIK